jgi:hypothetical protein
MGEREKGREGERRERGEDKKRGCYQQQPLHTNHKPKQT